MNFKELMQHPVQKEDNDVFVLMGCYYSYLYESIDRYNLDHDKLKEQDQYRLFLDTYNYILLTISYIESNTIWLSNSDSCYKYDRKTERLYKWVGDGYERVDTEYGFSKLSGDDVWESRKQPLVDYSGFYGD